LPDDRRSSPDVVGEYQKTQDGIGQGLERPKANHHMTQMQPSANKNAISNLTKPHHIATPRPASSAYGFKTAQTRCCSNAILHVYEVRPRKDHRGVDLISDALPFGRLWYGEPDHAIGYAMHSSRSHDALIRVYDESGNVIETQEQEGEFKEW
jgi:hypothetical protein